MFMRYLIGHSIKIIFTILFFFAINNCLYGENVKFTVSEKYGTIEETYNGIGNKLIVCIKDYHADGETQLNIFRIIKELRKNNRFGLVCLEGAYSQLDVSFYDQFPDKNIKEKVSKYFLNKAIFTGSEYYNIVESDRALKMYGVEDRLDYLQNINRYLDVQLVKDSFEPDLELLKENMLEIKKHVYSEKLKQFDENASKYHKSEINLDQYLAILTEVAKNENIPLIKHNNINKYIKLKRIQERINPEKVDLQIYNLDKNFSCLLSEGELNNLKKYIQKYRIDTISGDTFLNYIYSLHTYSTIMDYSPADNALDHLMQYNEYNSVKNSIDFSAIQKEIGNLENEIYIALCDKELQVQVYKNSTFLNIIDKLCANNLTPHEIESLSETDDIIDIKPLVTFIKDVSLKLCLKINESKDNYNSVSRVLYPAWQFYRLAMRRNNHFVDNTLEIMSGQGANEAVLISGGFHIEGIKEILKQKNISYIVIRPQIKYDNYLSLYNSRVTGEFTSIDTIMDFFTQTLGLPLITSETSNEDQVRFAKVAFATLYGISEQLEKFKNDHQWQPFTDSDLRLLTKSIQEILSTHESIKLDELQKIVHHVILGSKMGDAAPINEAEHGDILDKATKKLNTGFGENGKLAALELTKLRKNSQIFTIEKFGRNSIGFNSIMGMFFRKSSISYYEKGESNIVLQTLRYCFELDPDITLEDIKHNPELLSKLNFNPVPERIFAVNTTGSKQETDNARVLSYALDHLDYEYDSYYAKITNEQMHKALMEEDEQTAKEILKTLGANVFIIQNSRNLARKFACSGQCWYCLACTESLKERLKTTQPSNLDSAVQVVRKAIKLGLNNIQITGDDTLDDVESFWKILDAAVEASNTFNGKDKPINLSITTNGLYFLRNISGMEDFFKELKRRCGKSINPSIRISFDSGKVKKVKNWIMFKGDEEAVYKTFARIIHLFNKEFKFPSTLNIVSRDMDTGSDKQSVENYKAFHKKIQDILEYDFGWKEPEKLYSYSGMPKDAIIYYNTEALLRGLKQGRIYKQESTVEDLFDSIYTPKFDQRFMKYRLFFNMSMNSISDGDLFLEYPLKEADPDKLINVFLRSLSYPMSRRFIMSMDEEGLDVIQKQLGFALSLRPELKSKKQVTYEQVLSHLAGDESLMTQIERMFLMEDVLYTYNPSKFNLTDSIGAQNFRLRKLPQELAISLDDEELIIAFLTYFARYRMSIAVAEGLKPFIETFYTNPAKAVEDFRYFLNENVLTDLIKREIIIADPLNPDVTGKLSKTAIDKPVVELIDIKKDLKFDLKEELRKRLLSDNIRQRKTGLNLIGTILNDHYDLNEFKDTLLEFAFLEGLSYAEKTEFINLLSEWMSDYSVKTFADKNFFLQVMHSYALNQPYGIKDKALDVLIEVEDGTGVFLSKRFIKGYLEKIDAELPYLDPAVSLKFYVKCYENKLIKKSELSEIVNKLPVAKNSEHLAGELSKQWETFEKLFDFEDYFINLFKISDITRTDIDTRKFILSYLLAEPERQKKLLDLIPALNHERFIIILDTLKEMFFSSFNKNTIKFVNSLPVGYFENQPVMDAVFGDESLQHFMELHKSDNMIIYLSFMKEKDSITALRNYFKKAGLSPVKYPKIPYKDVKNLLTEIIRSMGVSFTANQENELASSIMIRLAQHMDQFNDVAEKEPVSMADIVISDPSIQNPVRSFVTKIMVSSEHSDDIKTFVQIFFIVQNETLKYVESIKTQKPSAISNIAFSNELIESSI